MCYNLFFQTSYLLIIYFNTIVVTVAFLYLLLGPTHSIHSQPSLYYNSPCNCTPSTGHVHLNLSVSLSVSRVKFLKILKNVKNWIWPDNDFASALLVDFICDFVFNPTCRMQSFKYERDYLDICSLPIEYKVTSHIFILTKAENVL